MTLIQAQQKYIDRVTQCHPGHKRRVGQAARAELYQWAEARGMDAEAICKDARDVANLELASDE